MVPLNPAQIFLSRSFAQRHCTFWPWLIDWSQYFPSVFPIQKKTPFLKSLLSVWSSMPIWDLILVTVYGDCIHRPLVWVHCSQVSLRWMMNVFCRRGSWQQSRNPDGTEFNFFRPLYWASVHAFLQFFSTIFWVLTKKKRRRCCSVSQGNISVWMGGYQLRKGIDSIQPNVLLIWQQGKEMENYISLVLANIVIEHFLNWKSSVHRKCALIIRGRGLFKTNILSTN